VLYQAMARRGMVRKLLLDNHASFSGYDLRLLSHGSGSTWPTAGPVTLHRKARLNERGERFGLS